MNLEEYKKVENLNYDDYCQYLIKKHGPAQYDYMSKTFNKNNKVTRSKEGLYCHHIREDKVIKLSDKRIAALVPYEFQLAKNLLYCDLLEHFYLHILICEKQQIVKDKHTGGCVGIGGIVNFIGPELNDLYSGFKTNSEWQKICHKKVINDKDVYLELVKRIIINLYGKYPGAEKGCLNTSYNEAFGLWSVSKNNILLKEIASLEKQFSKKTGFKGKLLKLFN